jgi:hypothetical protein
MAAHGAAVAPGAAVTSCTLQGAGASSPRAPAAVLQLRCSVEASNCLAFDGQLFHGAPLQVGVAVRCCAAPPASHAHAAVVMRRVCCRSGRPLDKKVLFVCITAAAATRPAGHSPSRLLGRGGRPAGADRAQPARVRIADWLSCRRSRPRRGLSGGRRRRDEPVCGRAGRGPARQRRRRRRAHAARFGQRRQPGVQAHGRLPRRPAAARGLRPVQAGRGVHWRPAQPLEGAAGALRVVPRRRFLLCRGRQRCLQSAAMGTAAMR